LYNKNGQKEELMICDAKGAITKDIKVRNCWVNSKESLRHLPRAFHFPLFGSNCQNIMISRSAADDVAPSAPREDFEPRQGSQHPRGSLFFHLNFI
jgi:hypothetical protein